MTDNLAIYNPRLSIVENVGQDVAPRSSGPLAALALIPCEVRAGTSDGGRLQATLDSPGLAPVVGVIAPQLKTPPTAKEIADREEKRRTQQTVGRTTKPNTGIHLAES